MVNGVRWCVIVEPLPTITYIAAINAGAEGSMTSLTTAETDGEPSREALRTRDSQVCHPGLFSRGDSQSHHRHDMMLRG